MRKSNDNAWEHIELLASAARVDAGSQNGSTIEIGDAEKILLIQNITASATEAGDTLDCFVDISWDGTNFYNAVQFTQQAGNGSARKEIAVLDAGYATDPDAVLDITADAAAGVVRQQLVGPFLRVRWEVTEVTGDNASHTFDVQAYVK